MEKAIKTNNMSDSESRYKLMTEAPVAKLIISMSIPAICSQIVSSLYNMADTYFVSSLGSQAVAAPGIAFPLMLIIQAVSLMLAIGAGSLSARQLGEKNNEGANVTVSTAFFLSVFIGTTMGIVSLIFLEQIMVVCGATETILPYAYDYGFWIIAATPFYSATFVLSYVIRQEGNVRLSTIGTVAGAVINCILDPLFIFGFGMGIKGAAIATSLSQIVSFLILFIHVIRKKCVVRLGWKYFRPRKDNVTEILKVGSPNLYQSVLLTVGLIVLNNSAKIYGGDAALAGMNIVTKISNMIVLALNGFGQGFQPMCGYCYGAKLYKRVKEGVMFTIKIGLIVICVLSLLAFIFSEQIIGAFNSSGDPDVQSIGVIILKAHLVVMPLLAVTTVANMFFLSCGKALNATIIALARNGIVFFPVVLILPKIFGLSGVIATQPVADFVTFIIAFILFIKELKVLNRLDKQQ